MICDMARRKPKKTRTRRKKSGVSIIGLAETAVLTSVVTSTLFNVNAYDFFMAPTAAGGNAITIRELFNTTGTQSIGMVNKQGAYGRTTQVQGYSPTVDLVVENLKANWMKGVVTLVATEAIFRAGKQIARPAISKMNRLLSKTGIAQTVKV